jgi:hypothetical protein
MIGQDVRQVTSAAGHILRTLASAFFKIVLWFLGVGVIGAGAVEGVAYFGVGKLSTLSLVAAIVLGVIVGYAAGLTVLVSEAVRALITASKEAEKGVAEVAKGAEGEIGKALSGAGGIVGEAVKAVEGGVSGLEHHQEKK